MSMGSVWQLLLVIFLMPLQHFKWKLKRVGQGFLLYVVHQGWQDVNFECDCSMMITALAATNLDLSEVGRIVEDCREYMTECSSFHIKHVFREANGVTHRLAHFASLSVLDGFRLDKTPSIIEDVLYDNYYNCT